jgi:site-specific DNA-methyltransferase (adenine-specific)
MGHHMQIFEEWSATWLSESFRVLRPGGVIKAFSGSRTFHRMTKAMSEVGFVDISLEAWAYGSGFPKSMNVSKAIDKAARGTPQGSTKGDPIPQAGRGRGTLPDRNALNFGGQNGGARTGLTDDYADYEPATDDAKKWQGWGTALKPAWEPVVVGRKP